MRDRPIKGVLEEDKSTTSLQVRKLVRLTIKHENGDSKGASSLLSRLQGVKINPTAQNKFVYGVIKRPSNNALWCFWSTAASPPSLTKIGDKTPEIPGPKGRDTRGKAKRTQVGGDEHRDPELDKMMKISTRYDERIQQDLLHHIPDAERHAQLLEREKQADRRV
ncbi:predicted protein [Histoplasma capsulatum G186AR]|uniref:Uncharacterized protein n=1 Tax=Ajellomyces capsulatus (strain G186AR / H82 / ATCC MYA-2454 / RMSCC 2432) TaxID=447093 RepID=C0NV78_AJECG|nr:uncharacterized protein HCBG_06842 [Histoplasma capsulatum G186AR]EEH04891.1 predicted protein [Histoplasma capsulatum G186AR]